MKKIIITLFLLVALLSTVTALTSCSKETAEFLIGNEVYATAAIKDGQIAKMPQDPTNEKLHFLGWFTEDGKVWDGNAYNGLKVYASWLEFTKNEDGTYTLAEISEYHTDKITIPEKHNGANVTAIGEKAFFGLTDVSEVSIPKTVNSIGASAFAEMTKLTKIVTDPANESYKSVNGDLYSKDGTSLIQYAIAKADAKFDIPDEVVSIGDHAFSRAYSLTEVTIPAGITKLSNHAFYRCEKLTTVTFAENSALTSIGISAFSNCTSLITVTVPKNVATIEEWAFYGCKSMKTLSFEKNCAIYEIKDYAIDVLSGIERIYYDGSAVQWKRNLYENEVTKSLTALIVDIDSAGTYFAPEGAWTPTEEYKGITYGAWLTEEDYLAGLAPVKWYTSLEILTADIGTVDANGSEYADPDFIPGYVHLFADVTNTSAQLVIGHAQKLVLNLAGHTLTLSKGIRVGGNYGSHPEASLTIKFGTINFTAGQIQPRQDSTLVFESVVFTVSVTNSNIFYGAGADFIHFKNTELYVTAGATFMLLVSTTANQERSTMLFESTDVYYLEMPAGDAIFRITNSTSGVTAWDIIFDKDSSLNGEISKLVLMKEVASGKKLYPFEYLQTVTFEEGCEVNTNVESYDTYWMIHIDVHEDTEIDPEELPAVEYPADDEFCVIKQY